MESRRNVFYDGAGVPRAVSGDIAISHQVISDIAAHACESVQGFVCFSEDVVRGFARIFRGDMHRGISIYSSKDERAVDIEISVVLRFGSHINSVCSEIQQVVKEQVEIATDITVDHIHVAVQGMSDGTTERKGAMHAAD